MLEMQGIGTFSIDLDSIITAISAQNLSATHTVRISEFYVALPLLYETGQRLPYYSWSLFEMQAIPWEPQRRWSSHIRRRELTIGESAAQSMPNHLDSAHF